MSTPYSVHFACFDCRKSFSYEVSWKEPKAHICPECGQLLWYMGRKFKPPRRRDTKQWRKVELIRKTGTFPYPKYLWQAKNRVEAESPPKSEGEKLLRRLSPKK